MDGSSEIPATSVRGHERTECPVRAVVASYPASTDQRAQDRHLPVVPASCAILVRVPPPYDVHNFLNLLGIEIDDAADGPLTGYFTVTHRLIAGTGFLWAPVVVSLADALCAFGVSRN